MQSSESSYSNTFAWWWRTSLVWSGNVCCQQTANWFNWHCLAEPGFSSFHRWLVLLPTQAMLDRVHCGQPGTRDQSRTTPDATKHTRGRVGSLTVWSTSGKRKTNQHLDRLAVYLQGVACNKYVMERVKDFHIIREKGGKWGRSWAMKQHCSKSINKPLKKQPNLPLLHLQAKELLSLLKLSEKMPYHSSEMSLVSATSYSQKPARSQVTHKGWDTLLQPLLYTSFRVLISRSI